jgi:C4-dicarboxylate-specific signal transduction histidine kinase
MAELEPRFLVQVIDNGPGVEDPERIFDAFVTTKKTGMGIGFGKSLGIHSTRLPPFDFHTFSRLSRR